MTQGKRHWIVDAAWLQTKGMTPHDVIEISSEELQAIPEDSQAFSSEAPATGD